MLVTRLQLAVNILSDKSAVEVDIVSYDRSCGTRSGISN